MASPKRPTLAQTGVDKLFQPSETTTTTVPGAPTASAPTPSQASWEATHRRRTFHCDNAVWDRLVAWCRETGTSHSAAIEQALEAFLVARGR